MTSTASIMIWFIGMAVAVSALIGGGTLLASRSGQRGHFHLHRPHFHG